MSGRRVAIVQSNYIPWKGYFDLIAGVDEFVLYDDVQYTRRDWRNRNQIKTAQGLVWLTIPVDVAGKYHQRIDEVVVNDDGWAKRHWQTIVHQYSAAPASGELRGALEALYREAPLHRLSEINEHFLTGICRLLGIATPLRRSRELAPRRGGLQPDAADRSDRLLTMCRALGAAVYVSGPAARGYLDETRFNEAGIEVEWADYSGYPEYRQLHPPFRHEVSIVDLLLNEGRQAPRFMKHVRSVTA